MSVNAKNDLLHHCLYFGNFHMHVEDDVFFFGILHKWRYWCSKRHDNSTEILTYFTIMLLHNWLGIPRQEIFVSRPLVTTTICSYLRQNRRCSQKHKLLQETVTQKRSGQALDPTVSWQANWRHTMGLLLFQTATDW